MARRGEENDSMAEQLSLLCHQDLRTLTLSQLVSAGKQLLIFHDFLLLGSSLQDPDLVPHFPEKLPASLSGSLLVIYS